MNNLSYADIGRKLDEEEKGWSKQERAEFGIIDVLGKVTVNRFNQYDGTNEYIKEIKSKAKVINEIQDLQEQLKLDAEALPWEE